MAVDQLQINERLFLKIPLEQDAKRISELVNKNRAEFKLYFSWCQQEESLAAAQAVIKKNHQRLVEGTMYAFAIFYDEQIVGMIDLHEINQGQKAAKTGYWLDRDFRGRGIITESEAALIKFAFSKLRLHRLVLEAQTRNKASQAVAKRLNFNFEGIKKESDLIDGEFFDMAVYSKINSL